MLVCERASRIRIRTNSNRYLNCRAKAYTTQTSYATHLHPSFYARHSQVGRFSPRSLDAPAKHSSSTLWARNATGSALAASISPLENSFQLSTGLTFDNPEDVRSYLKQWSHEHQKRVKENAPDRVLLQRDAVLPNSLFIRNNTEAAADAEVLKGEPDTTEPGVEYGGMYEVEDIVITVRPQLQPGDALRIRAKNIRPQLAIYLGKRDVQALYFLADGRWLADCRTVFDSHVIQGFATQAEMSRIEKHLPLRSVEYVKADDGGTVPFSVLGEIPHGDSRPLLDKLAKLAEDVEAARREYPAVNDRLYSAFADEREFKQGKLEKLVSDILHIDYNTLTEGAKMFLYQEAFHDERLTTWSNKDSVTVLFLPKKMYSSVMQVTQWARSYQDAAARAAMGKGVTEELKENPLIPFVSKARRLISKSRKIRLPTMECELGPTLEGVRPPPGTVERRPTGEIFTEDEKKIIEFLWLIYVKRPTSQGFGVQRNAAIASLVVRAVGAYPKFRLDFGTGTLFLKELGCLDPWTSPADYYVSVPVPSTVLHQDARVRKEEAMRAANELGLQHDDQLPRLPDTMAHLRKDWSDLDVFCIDSQSTIVVDDGISVEQSKEFPDHYWVRVHIADIAAFIPLDSPLLALGPLMGATRYHQVGAEPFLPLEAVLPCSLRPDQRVLTISTLLGPDGSIKDIDVRSGIIRNVTRIHNDVFQKVYNWPSSRNSLSVGCGDLTQGRDDSIREQEQLQLVQRHRATFDALQKLMALRWEARYREQPEHLKNLKLPNKALKVRVEPARVVQAGKDYERIFRSEHVIGDLSINVACSVADIDRVTYRDQSIRHNVVATTMMLACESSALWCDARDIPMIYRFVRSPGEAELSMLNRLGPHDPYVSPVNAEGLEITPHLSLAAGGYINITNPLRKYRDLTGHHQINAYLKAQGGPSPEHRRIINYPRSRQDLVRAIQEQSDGAEAATVTKVQDNQWLLAAMYRAFYFQEAKLPDVWDVFIDNPVNLNATQFDYTKTTKGTIYAIGLRVQLEPSEQGWEKMAKFRQWLPVKLTSIDPHISLVLCKAVGPPSDKPTVKDLQYPPMCAE